MGWILAPVSYGRVPLTFEIPHDAVSIVMARAQKLKVYRTAAGFNDAYVAAPSQKAALAAWGSEKDLFARGVAEIVTDPALTAEPLASPGVVVKQSRGTTAEQISAMPNRPVRSSPKSASNDGASLKPPGRVTPAAAVKPAPKPKPSSGKRDAAERKLDTIRTEYDRQLKALADREAKLARERREIESARRDDLAAAEAAAEEERRAYDDALREWRKSRNAA